MRTLLLVCLAACSQPAKPQAPATQPETPLVETLPPLVRGLLHDRMRRHGRSLAALYGAVGRNDLAATEVAGRVIVEEPRLARPTSDDLLNAQIPERFFVLQDDLSRRAALLVDAAAARDHGAATVAFESLSSACLNCHRVFFEVER